MDKCLCLEPGEFFAVFPNRPSLLVYTRAHTKPRFQSSNYVKHASEVEYMFLMCEINLCFIPRDKLGIPGQDTAAQRDPAVSQPTVDRLNTFFKEDMCRNLKECRLCATFTGMEEPVVRSVYCTEEG